MGQKEEDRLRLVADERSIPRIHRIATLVLVFLLTLALSGFYSWQHLSEGRASVERVEAAVREQVQNRLRGEVEGAISYIEFTRSRIEKTLVDNLVERVDMAVALAEAIYAQESRYHTPAELKHHIIESLRPMRFFDGGGYYFIDDMKGKFILLPTTPQLEGKTNLDNQDDTGRYIMRGLIDAAKKPRGEGIFRYRWYPPNNQKQMADKLSYVRYFPPYDWFIGTGDYVYKWEQLQQGEVLARLRSLRFSQRGLIAVLGPDGNLLLSPVTPELEGKPASELTEAQQAVLKQIMATGAGGGGFLKYAWFDPKTGQPEEKTGYAQTYGPWGWTILATVFDEDFQLLIRQESEQSEAVYSRSLLNLILAASIALSFGLLASYLFSRWSRSLFVDYHRQLAEKEAVLRQSKEHYQALADNGQALIWMAGLDQGCNYFNKPWLQFTGRSFEQEQGSGWADGVFSDDLAQCLEKYTLAFSRREPFVMTYRLRRHDGVYRWIIDEGRPRYDEDGQFLGYIGHCLDITDMKEAQDQLAMHHDRLEKLVEERTLALQQSNLHLLKAKEEADAANVAKSAFLANMSHEIRTPLNAITGMAYLIRRSGVTAEQSDKLSKIDAAGQHLLEIINAILDLSKIEAGKFVLEKTSVDIAQITQSVAGMLHEKAREKGLALRVDNAPLSVSVLGDPTRLKQALLNFANNAIKFTEAGGVTIRTLVQSESEGHVTLRFEVQDSGVGIAPDILPRLFSPFEQGDNSITRHYGGTGLGLAISGKLAELMGGKAGVESRLGEGSTFWFTACLKKTASGVGAAPLAAVNSAESTLLRDYQHCRILLVEDEMINREITLELLQDVGQSPDIAEDGLAALELAKQHEYDLILMDMQMPVMDGLEATRRIRALPNGGRVPILAMTANAFAEDRTRCFEAGINDFVAKPVQPDEMFELILKWLSVYRSEG